MRKSGAFSRSRIRTPEINHFALMQMDDPSMHGADFQNGRRNSMVQRRLFIMPGREERTAWSAVTTLVPGRIAPRVFRRILSDCAAVVKAAYEDLCAKENRNDRTEEKICVAFIFQSADPAYPEGLGGDVRRGGNMRILVFARIQRNAALRRIPKERERRSPHRTFRSGRPLGTSALQTAPHKAVQAR